MILAVTGTRLGWEVRVDDRTRRTLLAVLVACAVLLAPTAARAGDDGSGSESRPLSLELGTMTFDASRQFHLFAGVAVAPEPWQRGTGIAVGATPPHLTVPQLSPLRLAFSLDDVGRPRLQVVDLRPLSWDDLDGWQKMGVVLSYASAAAGAGYFLSKLF